MKNVRQETTPAPEILPTWQKQFLSNVAPVALIATAIGSLFVNQYRMAQVEKRLDKQEVSFEKMIDVHTKMSEDLITIKTTLGIKGVTGQSKSQTVVLSAESEKPTPQIININDEMRNDSSAQMSPTPVPTPENKRPDNAPIPPLPDVVPSIIKRIFD